VVTYKRRYLACPKVVVYTDKTYSSVRSILIFNPQDYERQVFPHAPSPALLRLSRHHGLLTTFGGESFIPFLGEKQQHVSASHCCSL
jgi:hypothetical protein